MEHRPRVVVIDADLTLVERGDTIHPVTHRALSRLHADKIPYILATGRPIPSALRLGRQINAAYVIALGGSIVMETDSGDVAWQADGFDPKMLRAFWQAAAHAGARLHAHTATGWHATIRDDATAEYGMRHDLPPAEEAPPTAPVLLLEVVGQTGLLAPDDLYDLLGPMPPAAQDEHDTYIDITPHGIGKVGGVTAALDLLGRTWAATWMIGDGGNDLPCFYHAARSIVVGPDPAAELIEAATHHVTLTPGEGAVGAALLHLVYGDSDHGVHVRARS